MFLLFYFLIVPPLFVLFFFADARPATASGRRRALQGLPRPEMERILAVSDGISKDELRCEEDPFVKEYTLAQVLGSGEREGQVLLGLKLRGFGQGLWNGFGGKVEKGEGKREAAVRELREEAGIEATAVEDRGQILFCYHGRSKLMLVHHFVVTAYEGEVRASEEMRPAWFRKEDIPYESMWADDRIWLPHLLAGESADGRVDFDTDGVSILSHDVRFAAAPHS